jgi:hypothetical protein
MFFAEVTHSIRISPILAIAFRRRTNKPGRSLGVPFRGTLDRPVERGRSSPSWKKLLL